jgi:hypothetical protein
MSCHMKDVVAMAGHSGLMRLMVGKIERHLKYFRVAPMFFSEERRCWLRRFLSSMMTKSYA